MKLLLIDISALFGCEPPILAVWPCNAFHTLHHEALTCYVFALCSLFLTLSYRMFKTSLLPFLYPTTSLPHSTIPYTIPHNGPFGTSLWRPDRCNYWRWWRFGQGICSLLRLKRSECCRQRLGRWSERRRRLKQGEYIYHIPLPPTVPAEMECGFSATLKT